VLAGLHSGKFAIDTPVDCRGYLWEPGVLTCFHKIAHGPVSAITALRKSCNVYCGTVGLRVGLPGMIEMFHMFGYDAPPGCGIGEMAGRLPTLDSEHNQAAYMGIGQSTVAVTPLHVANAMATIARGEEFVSPTLQVGGDDRVRTHRTLPLDLAHVAAVREGMRQVVNDPGGSGYHAFHDPDVPPLGFSVSGKTGTAQCGQKILHISATAPGQTPHDFVGEKLDMGWFAGFAPSDNPQVAFAILLEYVPEGETGGHIAGPVARKLMQLCKDMGYIK
jgi:penicillin-binding protein 2